MSRAVNFIDDYEAHIMKQEREQRRVIIQESKYGYTLSVRNTVLASLYQAYKERNKIHGALSDLQRFIWERAVKLYINAEYYRMYRTKLYTPVIGWQEERLEECVRLFDIKKAGEEILQLTADPKVIEKAKETYLKHRKEYI